jgi:hypothetical protein
VSRAQVETLLNELGWPPWDSALSLLLAAAVLEEERTT